MSSTNSNPPSDIWNSPVFFELQLTSYCAAAFKALVNPPNSDYMKSQHMAALA
jgi:hypothetical protein